MTIEERQEAAKWFQNRASHTTMPGAKMMFKRAAEALSEGMQPQWIPCSERLPFTTGSYLVTVHPNYIVPGCIHVDILSWFNGKWWFYMDGQDTEFPDPIIAWMPLPEPYRGESE